MASGSLRGFTVLNQIQGFKRETAVGRFGRLLDLPAAFTSATGLRESGTAMGSHAVK